MAHLSRFLHLSTRPGRRGPPGPRRAGSHRAQRGPRGSQPGVARPVFGANGRIDGVIGGEIMCKPTMYIYIYSDNNKNNNNSYDNQYIYIYICNVVKCCSPLYFCSQSFSVNYRETCWLETCKKKWSESDSELILWAHRLLVDAYGHIRQSPNPKRSEFCSIFAPLIP